MSIANIFSKIVPTKPDVRTAFVGQGLFSGLAGAITSGVALEKHEIESGLSSRELLTIAEHLQFDKFFEVFLNAPDDPLKAMAAAVFTVPFLALTAVAAKTTVDTYQIGKNVNSYDEAIKKSNLNSSDGLFRVASVFNLKQVHANACTAAGAASISVAADYSSGPAQMIAAFSGVALLINAAREYTGLHKQYKNLEDLALTAV